MTKAGEQPTITQADRDAVADYLHGGRSAIEVNTAAYFADIRKGMHDDNLLVQAFARHRTTSLAAQDEWIEHNGGNCPCDPEAKVEIVTHGGDITVFDKARSVVWNSSAFIGETMQTIPFACVVKKYRVITPAPSLAAQDGLVERVARALCVHEGRDPDDVSHEHNVPLWSYYTTQADAALSALKGDKS